MMRVSTILIAYLAYFISKIAATPIGVDSTAILTPFSNLDEITSKKLEQKIQPKAFTFVTPFPDSGRKHAVTEQEYLLSKIDTSYGRLQEFVGNFFNPKPIVDGIKEEDKYGNDGGKARRVGTAFIGGVEAFSNVINAAADAPFEAARQVAKKISTSLNQVGGKVVGLSYYNK